MAKRANVSLFILAAALVISFLLTSTAFAKVNVRLANEANKMNRLINSTFLKGYYLINSEKITEEGKGKMGGDSSVLKIFYSKKKADYDKLKKKGDLFKTDATMIAITVDFYPTKELAKKALKNTHMKKADPTIGDETWMGAIKLDTRLPEREDNYNALQLVILKGNAQIMMVAYNYKSEPGEDVWKVMQTAAKSIANTIK